MADPLSIVAVIGLAVAGRIISQNKKNTSVAPAASTTDVVEATATDSAFQQRPPPMEFLTSSNSPLPKEVPSNFADIVPNMNVNGSQVNDFRNRPYMSGKMNNVAPIAKEMVGPGLGVGADTPAYGGYQQLYQVRPTNVNAYKLTTLPGRTGPAADITGGRGALVGELTHEPQTKTVFLPERRPNTMGRAQGQGGALTSVVVRGEYEKTKRTTNRAETSLRTDGLNFAPAKRFTSTMTVDDIPTRNKGDESVGQYNHVDNPTPGIHSFVSGIDNTPIMRMMQSGSADAAADYGLRVADRKETAARTGNAGRMNVRAGPLNQGGALTAVRSDTNRYDGRVGPVNGGWTQTYTDNSYHQFNSFKGTMDARASNSGLNIAKNVLANNPLNHPLS